MVNKTLLKKELNKKNFGSFYNTVGGSEGDKCFYPTRLDTYGKGCYYDCKYCYAKQLLDDNDEIPTGSVVRLGGMTDCFQPIERIKRNTYKTIHLLNQKQIHYLIVTKSDLIIRPEYLQILDKNLAHIQVSVPTDNNEVLKYTDNAKTFEARKKTIEVLYSKDYDVSLRLAPFLYNTVDYDKINNIQVEKCLVEFLRINNNTKKELNTIIDLNEYTVKENGCRHLPLTKKLNILSKLKYKQLTVCDDVTEHYNYFLNNINYNPNDCCNLTIRGE